VTVWVVQVAEADPSGYARWVKDCETDSRREADAIVADYRREGVQARAVPVDDDDGDDW
jgi:hypothetical protein